MHTLSVLAAEGIHNRDLWYPTILGVLVVIAAVGLFVGTPILLLATNMGTRLGFLVGVGVPRRASWSWCRCSGSPTRRRSTR